MSKNQSNQKWVFIGIAVVALLAVAFWYFTQEEEGAKQISDGKTTPIPSYAKPGEAESISDLSPACQKRFDSWSKWVKTDATWYKQIKDQAANDNVSIAVQLKRTYLYMYNREDFEC